MTPPHDDFAVDVAVAVTEPGLFFVDLVLDAYAAELGLKAERIWARTVNGCYLLRSRACAETMMFPREVVDETESNEDTPWSALLLIAWIELQLLAMGYDEIKIVAYGDSLSQALTAA